MPIEQFAPELSKIISTDEPILELADGFGGDQGPAEGPLWWKEGGYLLFSDIHNNRRMKHTPGGSTVIDREPTRPLYISYAVFCLKKKKKKTTT